jgi:hypothetical protein
VSSNVYYDLAYVNAICDEIEQNNNRIDIRLPLVVVLMDAICTCGDFTTTTSNIVIQHCIMDLKMIYK